jgi:hypothetical protein
MENAMKRRTLKLAAMLGTGGLILQLGGCGGALAQLLVQNVLTTVISNALSALVAGANAATAG